MERFIQKMSATALVGAVLYALCSKLGMGDVANVTLTIVVTASLGVYMGTEKPEPKTNN